MVLELIKKNQNSTTVNFRHRKRDLENYAELAIWNLNLKFEPQTIQDLRKILVMESHQNNAPNNCDKFFKYIVKLPSILPPGCTLLFFDLSFFFYFVFWFDSFFSCFYNTTICVSPEFYNFSSPDFNLISKISQHRIENRVILVLELKTVWRNFKNTMELMYMNLYGSNTQIWTQI